jgi:plasmid stabilization system protein ParE
LKRLRLSGQVREFILSETKHLKAHSPSAAIRFRADMDKALSNLQHYPAIGRKDESHPIEGVRRIVIGDYVVHYSAMAEIVDILRLRHARQSDPWIEIEDDDFEL